MTGVDDDRRPQPDQKDVIEQFVETESTQQDLDIFVVDVEQMVEQVRQQGEEAIEQLLAYAPQGEIEESESEHYVQLLRAILDGVDSLAKQTRDEISELSESEESDTGDRLRKLMSEHTSFSVASTKLYEQAAYVEASMKRGENIDDDSTMSTGLSQEPEGFVFEYDESDAEELEVDFESLLRERKALEQAVQFHAELFGKVQMDSSLCTEGEPLAEASLFELGKKIEDRLDQEVFLGQNSEQVRLLGPDSSDQHHIKSAKSIEFLGERPYMTEEQEKMIKEADSYESVASLLEGLEPPSITKENFGMWRGLLSSKAGGMARDGMVLVGAEKPTLHSRIMGLAYTGRMSHGMKTLVHELRHVNQFEKVKDAGISYYAKSDYYPLFEAQAYVAHPLCGDKGSVMKIIEKLVNPDGSYGMSMEKVMQAVVGIEQLNALGVSQDEIAEVIAEGRWAKDTGRYYAVEHAIERKKQERKIGDADLGALCDRLWIERDIMRLKAQQIAQKELLKHLGEDRIRDIMGAGATPHYDVVFSETSPTMEPGQESEEGLFVTDHIALWPKSEEYPYGIDQRKGLVISMDADGRDIEVGEVTISLEDGHVVQTIVSPEGMSSEQHKLRELAYNLITEADNGVLADRVMSEEYLGLVDRVFDRAFEHES